MKVKINQIAKITSGNYAKSQPLGDVFFIVARDYNKYKELRNDLKPILLKSKNLEKHYLNTNDILFASKGFDNFAVVYKKTYFPAVASSTFLVIQNIKKNIVLPGFLAWYINHPRILDYLKSLSKGTSLPSISKKVLGNLEINIPSLEKQRTIMKINELRIREKQLKAKIENFNEKIVNQILLNTITN